MQEQLEGLKIGGVSIKDFIKIAKITGREFEGVLGSKEFPDSERSFAFRTDRFGTSYNFKLFKKPLIDNTVFQVYEPHEGENLIVCITTSGSGLRDYEYHTNNDGVRADGMNNSGWIADILRNIGGPRLAPERIDVVATVDAFAKQIAAGDFGHYPTIVLPSQN